MSKNLRWLRREDALIAYFLTISADPRVRAAGWSLDKLAVAVYDCMKEDLPSVANTLATTSVQALEDRVIPAAEMFVRHGSKYLIDLLGGKKPR